VGTMGFEPMHKDLESSALPTELYIPKIKFMVAMGMSSAYSVEVFLRFRTLLSDVYTCTSHFETYHNPLLITNIQQTF
jgi:hypothetical protein